MAYNGHPWPGREQRRSHPYQPPPHHHHYQQRQNQDGYRDRYDQGGYDRRGHSDHFNRHDSYNNQPEQSYPRYQPHYSSASSIPSHFSHPSNFNDRYHDSYERRSDSFERRNDSNNGRGDYRRSMPELRNDLRPPEGTLQSRGRQDDRCNTQSIHASQSGSNSYSGPPIDLQQRTLRVTAGYEFDKRVTKDILQELFIQVGPVRNIVLKPTFAFIEFQDVDSVGYALAALDGVQLFGRKLNLEPKIKSEEAFKYLENLRLYEQRPELFGNPE